MWAAINSTIVFIISYEPQQSRLGWFREGEASDSPGVVCGCPGLQLRALESSDRVSLVSSVFFGIMFCFSIVIVIELCLCLFYFLGVLVCFESSPTPRD